MSEQLNLFQTSGGIAGSTGGYTTIGGNFSIPASYYVYDAEKEAFRSENMSLKEQLRAANKANENLIEVLKLLVGK